MSGRPRYLALSLRWKLILAVCVPVGIAGALILARSGVVAREQLIHQRREHLLLEADLYASRLDGRLRALEHTLRATAALLSGADANADYFEIARRVVRSDPLVYGSCIAFEPRASGMRYAPYVCREVNGLRELDIAAVYDYPGGDWDWFSEPIRLGAPYWSRAYFDEGAGDILMVTYSAPFERDGRIVGVVTLDVPLDQLQTAVEVPAFEHRFAILDRSGTFLSSPDPNEILELNLFQLANRQGLGHLATTAAEIMRSGRSGLTRAVGLEDDRPQLTCFSPISSTGWTFVAQLPEAQVVAPLNAIAREIVGFGLAGLIGLILALAFISSRVVAPIRRLAADARRIGAGDFGARAPASTRSDEIGDLSRAFDAMVRDLKGQIRALRRETAARESVESELRVARHIQEALLPRLPAFPDRDEFDLHAINRPARHMAGDFYDFFLLDERTLCLVIADVSGKGVPAAMVMAVTRTLVRELAMRACTPAEVLQRVNAQLLEDNDESMFVTIIVAMLDTRTGELRYANGGHPSPLVLHADGAVGRLPVAAGPLVGLIEDARFREQRVTLASSDRLVLYTDGVTESQGADSSMLGSDGLIEILCELPDADAPAICAAILAKVDRFQGPRRLDDVTVLVLAVAALAQGLSPARPNSGSETERLEPPSLAQ